MRVLSNLLSIVFHPLLLLSYIFFLLYSSNHYIFGGLTNLQFRLLGIYVFILTFAMPFVSVLLMRALGFVSDIRMPTMEDRVGPYIAVGVFYIWTYLNMSDNIQVPPVFRVFVLGATIALAISFFVNVFSKISMHAVGMGGFVAMLLLLHLYYSYTDTSGLLLGGIVAAGAVGTARLLLKAHEPNDIFGGYMVGFVCQFLAFRLLVNLV
jgi:membrane-associated phospholipid phosphatase